jgi:DNA-binding FadR family transcriptional regulator
MGRKRGAEIESAAYRAARTLRAEILVREQGDSLGSEDELVARLGISRPTLRQAARLLEHEQLLRVRRGVGGGYSVRKPDIGSVTRAAAFFLQARRTTMRDVLTASEQLNEAVMMRAAQSRDAAARARLVRTLAEIETQRGERPDATLLAQDLEFIERVLELAANPPLELFVRTLYQFGITQTSTRVFRDRADRVAGDTELTALLSRRRTRTMLDWIAEDRGDSPGAALESLAREPFDAAAAQPSLGSAK